MSAGPITQTARYVYAFARTKDLETILVDAPEGLGNASLELIHQGELAVVASPTSETKLRPQRKNLAAHQTVVGWLTERCSILPVAFGLIADDSLAIERLLDVHAETLADQLDRVDGRVEMSLTLRWAVDNVFQYFVEQHEGLQVASRKIAQGEATRDEQIELGRQFEALLTGERQRHFDHVVDQLGDLLAATDRQSERDEFDVCRIACLIDRKDIDTFSDHVYRIAEGFNDKFAFAFNGPWAPYSFVSLSLSFH